MLDLQRHNNPYNDDKVMSACSIFGAIDTSGRVFPGDGVIKAIANMHNRSNGLGGGFAVYGIYPQYGDNYAFHIMYLDREARKEAESFLRNNFHLVSAEEIPTRPTRGIHDQPYLWRYFLKINGTCPQGKSEEDFIVEKVMEINTGIRDAFVFSSGKNMGVFKGVGFPEDIAEFFCLDQYRGYLWTAHGRFPTNTGGWWGGAHPFNILDWTVVHNGEISSYGINRRYLEMFGYHCTMQTDTEVVAYAVDLLMRRHGLPIEIVAAIFAPAFWDDIGRMSPAKRELHRTLRQVYGSLLLNGPFTVIIAHQGEMIGLTDRVRLRPLIAASKGPMLFLSSEESAIRLISPDIERSWIPTGGEPVIGRVRATPCKAQVPIKESVASGAMA